MLHPDVDVRASTSIQNVSKSDMTTEIMKELTTSMEQQARLKQDGMFAFMKDMNQEAIANIVDSTQSDISSTVENKLESFKRQSWFCIVV